MKIELNRGDDVEFLHSYKVEFWPLHQVRPYERNPRMNDGAVAQVAASIKEFGFRKPIVVDVDGVIIAGHTCHKAAQLLQCPRVPVHVAADLTPAQVQAYRLADNKACELATWDYDLLPLELADLQLTDFDMSLLGFSATELATLLAPPPVEGLEDEDAMHEPPAAPITQPGDLWILGNHRLLCGDSSKSKDVDRLLEGKPIHLVNMDPPYNVAVEPRGEIKSGRKQRAKDRPIKNDSLSDAEFHRMLMAWFGNAARVLLPGRAFYIWGGYANVTTYPLPLRVCYLHFSQAIIWVKHHPVICRKDFMGDHEWCFYGWREGAAHEFFGPDNIPDVWEVKKVPSQEMVHLTQKPVELATRAMEYSTRPGEHVLDLFGGSGSTLIAAEKLGRHAFLMELDAAYCDVIVDRWQKFTGRTATRQDSNK